MFEGSENKAIEIMMDKYINDMSSKCKDETFMVFELINKQYKNTGKCPIHDEDNPIRNQYRHGNICVASSDDLFIIYNEPIECVFLANYCPICGKKLGE